MDFTVEQFLGMFHRYNEAIWPLQIVGYALGLLIVTMLVARVRGSESFLASHTMVDRVLPLLLTGYWAWMGVVFMWGYQADISARAAESSASSSSQERRRSPSRRSSAQTSDSAVSLPGASPSGDR